MIIKRSPFLEEALIQGIINISALARQIQPDVERELRKEVTEGAVVMALNRFLIRVQKRAKQQGKLFSTPPDLMVRSNLFEVTFSNSKELIKKRKEFLEQLSPIQNYFITFTQGIYETMILEDEDIDRAFFIIKRLF
ncbi:MAG: hypothetical protein A2161_04930 [Candidatus Schekmanbacteria bacterium RBG_13_48_7]|uniref:Uncharacterized protein n=1 Tax=Candidatus Schekmanbacteria bacterium RBG_13_48_7 TaxID=1817878 RepID=A0A1F7RLL5_9BACT|nr:MAG: hypothetical protein A2161_04930 [Candidatus Schekmanbacteria bacterium RBG_13_48_7]